MNLQFFQNISGYLVAHDYQVTGDKDGVNTVFSITRHFVPGSTLVFKNGSFQTPDDPNDSVNLYDYAELGTDQIEFHIPPQNGNRLAILYKPMNVVP